MKVGDRAEISRSFGAPDLAEYARLSGQQVSGERVPEPLIGGLFSYLLGVRLPGLGTMYLKQETRYPTMAAIGETLTARVEITRLRPEKQLADLATTCWREDGTCIASGRALVYIGAVEGAAPGDE